MAAVTDVVIVGGGIIGLAIAREVSRAGLAVRLLEKGQPGCEASGAAAGLLAAQLEAEHPGPMLALGLASRDLYPSFAAEVREESGIDPELQDEGTLLLARAPQEMAALDTMADAQRSMGLPVERLGPDDLRRLEPALAPDLAGALLLPRDVSVDNTLLVRALHQAAARAGARVQSGAWVTHLLVEGGRVTGVEAGGERIAAGAVVIAAGAWSGGLAGRGIPPLPAHPVRGQIVCLDPPAPLFRRILFCGEHYLVRRRDGRVLIGSTMERVGFDKSVTAGAMATLTGAAIDIVPGLREAPVLRSWAGLRPATADDLPAIGPGAAPGLSYACGHLRNGILLAPITARTMGRLLRGESPGIDLAPFSPLRFAQGVPEAASR